MRIKTTLNKSKLRVLATIVCTLVMLSALSPISEATWNFLTTGQVSAAQLSMQPSPGGAQIDFSAYGSGFTAGQLYNATLPGNINSGSGLTFSVANHIFTYHLSGGKMQWTDASSTKTKSIGAVLSSIGTIQEDNENGLHNKVIYAGAFLSTTIEYRAYTSGVKEYFVLSELPYNDGKIPDSYLEYAGELAWDSDLSVWVDGIEYPDKTFSTSSKVKFKDAANQTAFSFLAPIAWDSSGSICSATYDVKVSAGKIQYGLRIPYSWLETAVFPVTIDPSFTARTETYVNLASLTDPFDITVTKPTDTANGDILFCWIGWGLAVTIDSVPSGWTLLGNYTANNDKYALYYKIAASEGDSWNWSFSDTCYIRAVCSCYTGGDFDSSDPIDVVSNTAYRTLDTNCKATSMTVSANNSPLVFWGGVYTALAKTFTKPSVPTVDWVEDDDAGSTTSSFWTEVCSMIWSGSGATGDITATISGAPIATKHAFAVALNPAPSVVAPTVTTQTATSIYCTNFTANGNITATGGANCTTRGFCYMLGQSGDPTTANSTVYDNGAGNYGTGAYSKAVTGVAASNYYRVRAYAINSAGTGYGTTVQVTTLPCDPSGLTDTAHNGSSITLSWTLGTGANYTLIRYRTDQYPASTTDGTLGYNGTSDSAAIGSLDYGQKYYFRAWAWNSTTDLFSAGTSDKTSFTDPAAPTAFAVTQITCNCSIALSWTKGTGSDVTTVRYRSDQYPGNYTDGTQAYNSTGTSVNVTSLNCSATYYFRAWSYDTESGYYDSYAELTQDTVHAPTAITQTESNVGETTATINGKISDDGGASCEARFKYSKKDYCLDFDGDNDYVDVGTLGNYGSQIDNGTTELWFKAFTGNFEGYILGTASPTGGAEFALYLGKYNSLYEIDLDIASNSNWTSYFQSFWAFNLTDTNWHHLATTFNIEQEEAKLFIDGIEITNQTQFQIGGDWESSEDFETFYLGCAQEMGDESPLFFAGNLSDIRIWNVTRTQQQVQDNMNKKLIGNETGLFAYWKLDEGSGNETADATGNGNDGDIYGASWLLGWLGWAYTDWQNALETNDTYSANITGLNSGVEYGYQTQARNCVGAGNWSASENFTTLEACSPSISLNISSWSVNNGSPIPVSSNCATGLTYFRITNNSGGAVTITIHGTDMTGGGFTWDLDDTGSPGNMIYALKAGLDGGDYTIIVKETGSMPYNTLVSGLADNATQDFGLKLWTPTTYSDGNAKSGTSTMTVTCD